MPILQTEDVTYMEEELGAPFFIEGEGYNDSQSGGGSLAFKGIPYKITQTPRVGTLDFLALTNRLQWKSYGGSLSFVSSIVEKTIKLVKGYLYFAGIPNMIQEIYYRLKAAIGLDPAPGMDIAMAHKQPSSDGHALTASIEIDGTLASTV